MKKAILSSLILLLAFICLCVGTLIGRGSIGEKTMITYELEPVETQPPSDTAININTATVEQFMTLPGVGVVLAQRFVDYRMEYGPFDRIDDLIHVDGIGIATIDRFRDEITVGG